MEISTKMKLLPILLLVFVLSLGVACDPEAAPEPAPEPIATAVPTSVPTPIPTATATPIPTPKLVPTLINPQATVVKQQEKNMAQVSGNPLTIRELNYWEETSPLIKFAIVEGGTPLSKMIMQVQPGLFSGNQKDWETFITAVGIALPVYQLALSEWLEIQPPSAGRSPGLHRAYATAWAKRVQSLQAIVLGWRNGDDALLSAGFSDMDTAGTLSQRAETLRTEFNTYLYEQCNKHKYKECN